VIRLVNRQTELLLGYERSEMVGELVEMLVPESFRTVHQAQREQQRFLETIGTDAVQGYLYLRPTTADGLGTWLGAHLAGVTRTRHPGEVVIPFTPRHTA